MTRGGYRNRHDAAADGWRRTHRIAVAMSDAEKGRLDEAAEALGAGLAEFVRTAIEERIERERAAAATARPPRAGAPRR
jgi:predicted transcriptional regulator